MSKALGLAQTYADKAVESREQFYQGMREALYDLRQGRGSAASVADAKYKAGQSPKMQELVADNKWQMQQSMMFANIATAQAQERLLEAQLETNRLLKRLLEK
jgi:hypothetical protein